MFDFSKAVEFLEAGLAGTSATDHQSPHLLDILTGAGIDPSQLSGLAENEILSLLSEHGIDPAAIAGGQLDELLASLTQSGGLAGQLTGLLSDKLRF